MVLHGANVHFSHENTSPQSRHAYSMHVVEGTPATTWAADNWCAPDPLPSVDVTICLQESVPSSRMLGTLRRLGASPCCSYELLTRCHLSRTKGSLIGVARWNINSYDGFCTALSLAILGQDVTHESMIVTVTRPLRWWLGRLQRVPEFPFEPLYEP